MNPNGWIPDETPILESVFVDLFPNGEVYAFGGRQVWNLDSWTEVSK